MNEAQMIKCPKCYGEVDSRAQVCPHCGNQLKKGGTWQLGSMIGAVGLFVLGVSVLLGFWATGILIGAALLILGLVIRKQ